MVSIPFCATPIVTVPFNARRQEASLRAEYQYSPWGEPVKGITSVGDAALAPVPVQWKGRWEPSNSTRNFPSAPTQRAALRALRSSAMSLRTVNWL